MYQNSGVQREKFEFNASEKYKENESPINIDNA